jgi:hypothetical protein
MRLPGHFSHLKPHVTAFLDNCSPNRRNVFVMMRYRSAPQYVEIEETIRTFLTRRGLGMHLAKDHSFVPSDMWDNLCVYMLACDFGIAVFEEIDSRDFNPNVSIEVGFMAAAGKDVLLLKDQRMPRMPTDFCGHLYKDFDTYNITATIPDQLSAWLADLRARGCL